MFRGGGVRQRRGAWNVRRRIPLIHVPRGRRSEVPAPEPMAVASLRVIGGIHAFAGGPVEPAAIVRLNAAAKLLVPSRRRRWAGPSVALAGATAPPDAAGSTVARPSNGGRAHCALVFDGRIDNRKELIADLRDHGVDASTDDAGLVLAAYAAWGSACPSKLVGDFAFGLWDGAARRLLCARDPLGVRPLYVLVRDGLVAFASQLGQLLALCAQTPPLDMEYVADRLALGVDRPGSGRTPYRGLSRLEPGHRLVAGNGRVRIERYWEWRARPADLHGREADHVERFRATFADAVASRASGADVVWSELSGGLDSSSIVAVAARRCGRPRLSALSVVFGESTLSDERHWAAAVARASGVERRDVDGDLHHPFSRLRAAVRHWEEPHAAAAFFGAHRQYRRLMAGRGVPVLLSGIGAEAVVLSKHQEPVHLADLLRRGRPARFFRELDRWQRALKMPLSNLLLQYCLRPLLGRPRIGRGRAPAVHAWVADRFADAWGLAERARYGNAPRTGRGAADQWHVERVAWITGFLLRGYLEKACDLRYPFLHRPLVELALAAPWSLKAAPGEPKAILRRAMRGILPERVRRRTRNASTGHAAYNGLRKEWPALGRVVASSMLVELGVVDRERLWNAMHLARQGHAPHLGGLLTTLTLDAWLQAAAAGRRPPGTNADAA